jgi:hypothetical protein
MNHQIDMNPNSDDNIPPFDDAICEREWLAQEQAMRRERLHLDTASDDARMQRYRMLARALRKPQQESLPADFAQRVAARAASLPARKAASVTRFEFLLMSALAIALVTAAVVVTVVYGSTWLPSIGSALPEPDPSAIRWLLAFAGCLGLSWLLAQWQPYAHERPRA